MKRALVTVMCLAVLLTGCATVPDEVGGSESLTEDTVQTDAPVEKIYAVKDGAPQFTVVYSDSKVADSAEYLSATLKSKTGAGFRIARSPSMAEGAKIFVGLHEEVEDIYELYGENISYNGYGVVYKDGDVYICGYNETTVSKAAKRFLSEMTAEHIVKNEKGGAKEAYFPSTSFFTFDPSYDIKEPKLLGKALSEYTVVTDAYPSLAEKQLVQMCRQRVGMLTGAYLRIEASTDGESLIELSFDESLETFGYSVIGEGSNIRISYGGVCAMYAAFDRLLSLCVTDTSAGIEINGNARAEIMKDAPLSREDGADIRVMSFNLMGAGLEESYQCAVELRSAIAAEYILALSPDSVGFQEYNGGNRAEVYPLISEKYAVVEFEGVGVTWVATAYLKDKYTVKESKAINIRAESTPGDGGAQDYYFTWVVLEDNAGQTYIHANLHLDYRNDTLRLMQCEQIKAELDSVLEKYDGAVLVITGDYNSKLSADSPIFDAIKGETELMCASLLAPEGKRHDDRPSSHILCAESDIITGSNSAIDHILVSADSAEVKRHSIIYDGLICHASDHCPVVVDIERK